MKAKLNLTPHLVLENERTIEIWYEDHLVCTVTGADGPGVRIVSRVAPRIEHFPPSSDILDAHVTQLMFSQAVR